MTMLHLPIQRSAAAPKDPDLKSDEASRHDRYYVVPPGLELLDLYAAILIVVPLIAFLKSLWL